MDLNVKRWRANVFLFEEDGETAATAVLETGANTIHGVGSAKRNPADFDVEGIGDELAAGRALIALGRRLLGITEEDIAQVEGHPVHVSE
ncbi:DUF1876 domain-containing protein [Actinospica sp. MGRD01-02]|jgi:hypothetical protein|uniref:DUF1876 domain-containing protein n=1 Tax=Actinospica acidithermotolerans TaxID=2828514 RepID=A0A941EAS2_9ACTN|nr:DUF1876 domain-containing protein [Actinospica acidithermotolerans]MBR7825624.1 DUF1876 domain-containing protein [Actinospica acidithermotolerans]